MNKLKDSIEKNIGIYQFTDLPDGFSIDNHGTTTIYTIIKDVDQQNQGSNSSVLVVRNETTGLKVVLKIVKSYGDKQRFQDEIAYQQWASPYAPIIYAYGQGNVIRGWPSWEFLGSDMFFILMEYKGDTLEHYFESVCADDFYAIREKVIDAFTHILERGLYCKDVSLSNIVINGEKNVTVIDFDPEMTEFGVVSAAASSAFFVNLMEILERANPMITCDECGHKWDGLSQCRPCQRGTDGTPDTAVEVSLYHQFVSGYHHFDHTLKTGTPDRRDRRDTLYHRFVSGYHHFDNSLKTVNN